MRSARVLHSGSHKTETKVLSGCGHVWALGASSTLIQAVARFSLLVWDPYSLAGCQLGTLETPRGHSRCLPFGSLHLQSQQRKISFTWDPSPASSLWFLSLWLLDQIYRAHGTRSGPMWTSFLLKVHWASQKSLITGGNAILVTASDIMPGVDSRRSRLWGLL